MIRELIDKVLSTRVVIRKNSLTVCRLQVIEGDLFTNVSYVYFASFTQRIISKDRYELTDKATLKNILSIYKELTNYYNSILKK